MTAFSSLVLTCWEIFYLQRENSLLLATSVGIVWGLRIEFFHEARSCLLIKTHTWLASELQALDGPTMAQAVLSFLKSPNRGYTLFFETPASSKVSQCMKLAHTSVTYRIEPESSLAMKNDCTTSNLFLWNSNAAGIKTNDFKSES